MRHRYGLTWHLKSHLLRLKAQCGWEELPTTESFHFHSSEDVLVRVTNTVSTQIVESFPFTEANNIASKLVPVSSWKRTRPAFIKSCERITIDKQRKRTATQSLFFEAQEVLETCIAGIFVVEGNRIVVPPTDSKRLPSIGLTALLVSANETGFSVHSRPLYIEDIEDGFYCVNSTRGVFFSFLNDSCANEDVATTRALQRLWMRSLVLDTEVAELHSQRLEQLGMPTTFRY